MRSFFKTPALPTERQQLQQLLDQTQRELSWAYGKFNLVSDPELVEACVYEIKSLQTRSNYLLRSIKQLEGAGESGGEKMWA